jgi:hypothetical protein
VETRFSTRPDWSWGILNEICTEEDHVFSKETSNKARSTANFGNGGECHQELE